MRIAALYDIHGNLPALEAVLQEVHSIGVDLIIVGGDLLPGPMPNECADLIRSQKTPVQALMGNGEREILDLRSGGDGMAIPERFRDSVRWVAETLRPEHEEYISSWPATISVPISDSTDVLLCHATPRNDVEVFTKLTPEEVLQPVFEFTRESVVVCGHTHMQFDRVIGQHRVVNAGSVGMPFGEPGAYWLLIDSELSHRKTEYDMHAAAERVQRTNYPLAKDFAERNIQNPPTEADVLELFTKAEIGRSKA